MATDTTGFSRERDFTDEILRTQRLVSHSRDADPNGEARRVTTAPSGGDGPPSAGTEPAEPVQELALAPLVDQVAYGFARVLVLAMKELEAYIANENRKLRDSMAERLGNLQASFQDLTAAVSDQRSAVHAVQEQCDRLESLAGTLKETDARLEKRLETLSQDTTASAASLTARIDSTVETLQLAEARRQAELAGVQGEVKELIASVQEQFVTGAAALRECDDRQQSELQALRNETNSFSTLVSKRFSELNNELSVQQDDIAAIKSTVSGINARVDGVVERLDKQAEAVHSMYTTYAQRESELEQVIEGLTRLRSVPTPGPANRL